MKKLLSLAAVLFMLGLAAPVHAQGVRGEIVIGTPPPAVVEEAMPAPPGPPAEFVWHKGHWRWIDERYMWVPGHWAHRPRPAAVWVEPAYEQRPNGYVFVEGHWK